MPTLGNVLDCAKYELRNPRAHILGAAPASPVTGQFYFNSGDSTLYWWDGTTWVAAKDSGSTSGAAGGDLTGTYPNPQIAAGVIVDGDVNAGAAIQESKLALASDAAAGTASRRTIGTGALQAMAGNTRLDTIAAPTGSVSANSQKITNLLSGTASTDAANWGQVQALVQGVRWLGARVASTANLTLAGPGASIDGVALTAGDYVLVKNQTTTSQNGLYVWNGAAVAMTRAPEMDTAPELDGKAVVIEDGTQAGTLWVTTSDVTTLGTDPVSFTQFNKATDLVAGNGLTLTALTLDANVDNATVEINADVIRVKDLGITNAKIANGTIDLTTKVTGALPIANGGTGQTAAKAARETGLAAAGYYDNAATHGAGTTITITQATHGLRSTRGLQVTVRDETTGLEELPEKAVGAGGDVTITYGVAVSANSKRVTITG